MEVIVMANLKLEDNVQSVIYFELLFVIVSFATNDNLVHQLAGSVIPATLLYFFYPKIEENKLIRD